MDKAIELIKKRIMELKERKVPKRLYSISTANARIHELEYLLEKIEEGVEG